MPTPKETVLEFLAMWSEPGGFAESIRKYFTDATVYENVGMSKTTGIAESVEFAQGFEGQTQGGVLKVENLAVVTEGNLVLTERIDRMIDGAGKEQIAFRVMGIFEVEGDKITGWRDYFDTAGAFAAMGQG